MNATGVNKCSMCHPPGLTVENFWNVRSDRIPRISYGVSNLFKVWAILRICPFYDACNFQGEDWSQWRESGPLGLWSVFDKVRARRGLRFFWIMKRVYSQAFSPWWTLSSLWVGRGKKNPTFTPERKLVCKQRKGGWQASKELKVIFSRRSPTFPLFPKIRSLLWEKELKADKWHSILLSAR